MSEYSELIKNFDKVRDYMRDFFIYGYKTRSDFQYKSLRTYDNEKRRIESWLGNLVKFDTSKKGKQVAISLDSGQLPANPLFRAHKSKTFTDNDIRLHFFILDYLKDKTDISVEDLTDGIYQNYGVYFEPQTIRLKLKEYVQTGLMSQKKLGKAHYYSLSEDYAEAFCKDMNGFSDAVTFFSEVAPFGIIGSYILDQLKKVNETFLFKHHFIVHTLEDHILLKFLIAMDEKRSVEIINYGKKKRETLIKGVPLKVFVSSQTGRRYMAMYLPSIKRFNAYRLDYIKSVKLLEEYEDYDFYMEKFRNNSPLCWGVSFGSTEHTAQSEQIKIVFHIDEQNELFILHRLEREGRNGITTRVGVNTYQYTAEIFDISEMMNWVKTFTGRIISIEGTNQMVIHNFYNDINRMKRLYDTLDS